MRKIIFTLVPAIGLLLPPKAQGMLYVSNLGQTPTGSASIGSDAWIAQEFFTGNDSSGYTLNSIQLLMNAASGNPSGFTVSLYSSSSSGNGTFGDGSSLGILTGSDPRAGGIFTYTASGLTLSPYTYYFIVLTAATPVAEGAYVWSEGRYAFGSNQWEILFDYYNSANGSSWTGHARSGAFQMAIDATPVPEPATYALAGLGLAALSFWRRKIVIFTGVTNFLVFVGPK